MNDDMLDALGLPEGFIPPMVDFEVWCWVLEILTGVDRFTLTTIGLYENLTDDALRRLEASGRYRTWLAVVEPPPPEPVAKPDMRVAICKFLSAASVADHLGDIRNAEVYLYAALGVSRSEVHEASDHDGPYSPLRVLRTLAIAHDLPVPDYILTEDEDD